MSPVHGWKVVLRIPAVITSPWFKGLYLTEGYYYGKPGEKSRWTIDCHSLAFLAVHAIEKVTPDIPCR
jgi:hypothetical protein